MSVSKNISDLRAHLFDQLDMLCDLGKTVDIDRARMICETSKQIIDSAKVEIEYAQIMKGAITMPFIEEQAEERPYMPPSAGMDPAAPDTLTAPAAFTSKQRQKQTLNSGPPEDHPWRGLANRVVHRMDR